MPTYEYECEACEIRFEHLVGVGRFTEPHCPKCDGERVKRLITACRVGGVSGSDSTASSCSSCSSANCASCGR